MSQKHPILVAVDERGRTDNAVEAALHLTLALGAPIQVVHALGLPPANQVDSKTALDLAAMLGDLTQMRGNSIAERLQPLFSNYGLRVSDLLSVLRGATGEEVIGLASESDARLLVLGPHKATLLLDMGSTARSLLSASPCDVWVQNTPWRRIEHILVPIDLSEHSLAALRSALSLAKRLGAKLTCMHAWYAPELYAGVMGEFPVSGGRLSFDEARVAAESAFQGALAEVDFMGVEVTSRFVEAPTVEAILQVQHEVDLIAMGSHGRTGLAAAVLGNTTYAVLTHAECPVWAIRHPEGGYMLS
ncbi:MAG: nucleotide-binding universal stress UspA family protein [Planctomycetota bacterium]|jgi:nucleotide-binding universal stress UspA family protein